MAGYTLDAWIIQKKDQMEEISPTGGIIQAPAVQEVRTGQQFLIKLQLNKQGSPAQSSTKYPAMRVDRREAINTAGEPRAGAEPLTLQIIVHLAKSRQVRKVTDPSSYAHLDTTTGSVTILAKVICSSTDHGERGNKDRYLFEFRLRRTSSVLNNVTKMNISPLGADSREDDADTIASCYTAPIMCSGHHKAKRVYPNQRPSKVTKDGPMPKTKVVKRQKDIPSLADQIQTSQLFPSRQDEFLRSGSTSSSSTYPSPLSFMQDNVPGASAMSNFGDDQPSDLEFGTSTIGNQQLLNSTDNNILDPSQPLQPQPPRIFEVRPDHGPIRKITDVVLRGLFFRDGMVPYFGCFPAQDIVVETSNLIICKAPDSPLPGTVSITIYDSVGNTFVDLSQFTYTDDSETELLILQLQLRLAHRALEYLHSQATGQKGSANDILNSIPGLASASPRSPLGGNVMSDSADHMDDSTILTLDQVEEGILKTLDQLPAGFDISMPLDDQGNLLHLSILLGLDRLTMRLIEEGCELEALDTWGMTPLMYAVVKESELVVRSLVLAGATSSGAKTPKDFYNFLPRPVTPTRAVVGYLSVCCERYSKTLRTLVLGNTLGQPNLVQIEHEGTLESSESESDSEEQAEEEKGDAAVASQVTDENAPVIVGTAPKEVGAGMTPAASVEGSEDNTLAQLAQTLRGVHLTHDMPPLYQQDLPPMHVVGSDGSITVNMKVLKGDEIPRGVPGIQTITTDNEESGYHSGVYSEVQDRLSLLNKALLPSDGLKMTVAFHRAASSTPVSPAGVEIPTPENLFRTGDNFNIEIRLTTTVVPGVEYIPLPREFLGIRFPREMVKRVNGRPVSILNEMTYILRASIELGTRNTMVKASSSEVHQHQGDGIELKGACNNCAKYLHENKKVSPSRVSREDPTAYPILQFSVPAPVNPMQQAMLEDLDYNAEVMELHNGHVEVKARVNCSSLHHLVQREKARRAAELALPSSSSASSSSTPSTSASTVATGKAALGAKDLEDPGFVFMFELVHPTLNRVVAKFETGPFLFQSYSLKRRT
ncbi:SPT3 Dosage dependent suppressor of Ty-induced promoter mutations-like protein [Gamsiella multidivaricata]|nr:SPT3 Dosage dependent suppressor of Ty-induced promoter mutations-like protein [Gamsiella multidivaricata]